jgi:single-stranded-DNA-specific exonuclease
MIMTIKENKMVRWVIDGKDNTEAAERLAARGGISLLAAKVLVAGGYDTVEKAAQLLGSGEPVEFSDPMLIKDMEKACEIIGNEIENGKICIYGDYDCDGITATAVLADYFGNMGADVCTYINERSEGYGINKGAIDTIADMGVTLIVTVDNGISAIAEAEYCKERGIKLVVTDHHMPGDTLPDALAVVDPHRADDTSPYHDYCGCGLAMKLVAAMEGDSDFAAQQYADLAAVATIADIVPLTGENRHIVRTGLFYLENTERPGLSALVDRAGLKKPFSSSNIAFGLAPRINAAGRIASPKDALSLLLCEDEDEALSRAEQLCEINDRRHSFEDRIIDDICAMIKKDPTLLDSRVLFFSGEGWHHGVIGIAAARIQDRFGKPCFLMTREEGGEYRGSARAFGDFSVFEALSFCGSELLEKFGGHSGAGGFTVTEEKLAPFRSALEEYAEKNVKYPLVPEIDVAAALSAADLTVENVEGLRILEPFGEGNPDPVFLIADALIDDVVPLKGGEHTKLRLSFSGTGMEALMFRQKTDEFPFKRGERVNALVSLSINEFGGRRSVSAKVVSLRRKGISQQKLIAAEDTYFRVRRGEIADKNVIAYVTPSREDIIPVYTAVTGTHSPLDLYSQLDTEKINYCKFLLSIDILDEAGLIVYDRFARCITPVADPARADLNETSTMKRLRGL